MNASNMSGRLGESRDTRRTAERWLTTTAVLAAITCFMGCHSRGSSAARGDELVARPSSEATTPGERASRPDKSSSLLWSQYLADDAGDTYRTRARLGRYGAVRYAVDGPLLTGRTYSEALDVPEVVVVEQSPSLGRLRAVIHTAHTPYRLLLWLDDADLHRVAVKRFEMAQFYDDVIDDEEKDAAASVSKGGASAGVTVYPGRRVAIIARNEDLTKIAIRGECLQAEGWVRSTDVGTYYTDLDGPKLAHSEDEQRVYLREPMYLLDGPRGSPIATFVDWCEVRRVGSMRKGFIPVAVSFGGWEARGWIRPQPEPSVFVCLAEGGYYRGDGGGVEIQIPDGACLYDQRGGNVIGVVVDSTVEGNAEEHDGWWRVHYRGPWGPLPLWLEVDRAEDRRRREISVQKRGGQSAEVALVEEILEFGDPDLGRGRVVPFTMCR